MTEDVHPTAFTGSAVQQARPTGRSHGPCLHDLPSQRFDVVLAEHASAAQVPMLVERGRQSSRERHVTQAPTLGRRHLTVPGPADAELPVHEIHVGLLQRDHLAAP